MLRDDSESDLNVDEDVDVDISEDDNDNDEVVISDDEAKEKVNLYVVNLGNFNDNV